MSRKDWFRSRIRLTTMEDDEAVVLVVVVGVVVVIGVVVVVGLSIVVGVVLGVVPGVVPGVVGVVVVVGGVGQGEREPPGVDELDRV